MHAPSRTIVTDLESQPCCSSCSQHARICRYRSTSLGRFSHSAMIPSTSSQISFRLAIPHPFNTPAITMNNLDPLLTKNVQRRVGQATQGKHPIPTQASTNPFSQARPETERVPPADSGGTRSVSGRANEYFHTGCSRIHTLLSWPRLSHPTNFIIVETASTPLPVAGH